MVLPDVLPRGPGEPDLGGADRQPRRVQVRRLIATILLVVLIAACGLLALLLVVTDTGLSGLVVGVVLAVLPVVPVVGAFLWLDRYEHEPPGLLVFAFCWGAFVATFIALVLNTSSTELIRAAGGDPTVAPVLVAPVVEEGAKGLAVAGIALFRRREFDGVVDGIVYAGITAVGFAFLENVLYLGRSYGQDGGSAAAATFIVRCVFSPFAHPLFTSATGIGIGVAVTTRHLWLKPIAPVLGYAVAVCLHGLWNLTASSGLNGFVGSYVLLQLPIFVLFVVVAVVARAREARILRTHLGAYAASGWITAAEARMLGSLSERSRARAWAARTLGPPAKRSMADFQDLATEAAFLRQRMVRRTAPPDAPALEHEMLASMWRRRAGFLPTALGR